MYCLLCFVISLEQINMKMKKMMIMIIHADDVVLSHRYSDHFVCHDVRYVYACGWMRCCNDKRKPLIGITWNSACTVVLLDSLSKPVDFGFKRSRSAAPVRIFVLLPNPRWRVFTTAKIYPRSLSSRRGFVSPQSAHSTLITPLFRLKVHYIIIIFQSLTEKQLRVTIKTEQLKTGLSSLINVNGHGRRCFFN